MRKFGLKKQLGALPERKDYILTLAVLAVACVLSGLLVNFDGSSYVQLIFVLAVAVISRFTNGSPVRPYFIAAGNVRRKLRIHISLLQTEFQYYRLPCYICHNAAGNCHNRNAHLSAERAEQGLG